MIGKKILHYKIVEKIGEGGMGVVYKAEDSKLERIVAIKFLPGHIASNEEERERFKIEAKAAAALNNPNIATIHAIENVNDEIFIVMEYIDGRELKALVQSEIPDLETAIQIATQIAVGLKAAHKKGIIHRDIKSSNIMISEENQVRIMDFGLAKVQGDISLTKAGAAVGTVAYMSPEQARGGDTDERSDIWSFGVVLYELLTGKMPFAGEYEQALIYTILNETPKPLSESREGIPDFLEKIVTKCLAKEAKDRYQSAEDLLADLDKKQREQKSLKPSSSRRSGLSSQLRGKAILLGIAALFLITAAGYYFFKQDTSAPSERIPIAVVDFINETNEPELDGLSGMLITALEQSRQLSVYSRTRLYDEFKQLNRSDLTFVDETAGREIAKHADISALAVATIRKFGQLYTIDFKVIEPKSGDRLFSMKVEDQGQENIPSLLDQLSEKTRIDLKGQENTIQLPENKIADVTTINLEAYQHYFLGEQLMNRLDVVGAREEYRKAIALDSTFGLAYYRLASAFAWGFAHNFAKEPLAKALALIDRIPDKERYLLRAVAAKVEKGFAAAIPVAKEMERYYPNDKEMLFFIGDGSFHALQHQQAIEYFEKVLAIDPLHEPTLMHLAAAYRRTNQYDKVDSAIERIAKLNPAEALQQKGGFFASQGEYEKAITAFRQALNIDSTRMGEYMMIALTSLGMGSFEQAQTSARQWLKRNPGSDAYSLTAATHWLPGDLEGAKETLMSGLEQFPDSELQVFLGVISGFKGEYKLAESQFLSAIHPNQSERVRSLGLDRLARFYLCLGKYSAMAEKYDERTKMSLAGKDNNTAAESIALKAYWMYSGWRDKERVHKELASTSQLTDVYSETCFLWLALTYTLMGDFEKAEQASSYVSERRFKLMIESHTLLKNREWEQAISVNNLLNNKWDASTRPLFHYFNAICHYELGKFDKAIDEVAKAVEYYSARLSFYVYPQSFLLLGKIYEKKGNSVRAVENYEKFLDLWKDADSDLPDLIEAKSRLEKLKGGLNK